MKKLISMILVCMLLVGCVLSITSCGSSGSDDVPYSDPEMVVKALLLEKYEVDYEIAEEGEYFEETEYDGMIALIEAYYYEDDTLLEFITIAYFESDGGDAEEAYDDLRDELTEIEEELEIEDIDVGMEGSIVWAGTEEAIEIAAEAPEYEERWEKQEAEKDGMTAVPNSNPDALEATLRSLDYEVERQNFSPNETAGLVAIINGINLSIDLGNLIEQKLPFEMIVVSYYTDKAATENAYQAVQAEFEEIKEDYLSEYGIADLVMGKSDTMIWYGTPLAINSVKQ